MKTCETCGHVEYNADDHIERYAELIADEEKFPRGPDGLIKYGTFSGCELWVDRRTAILLEVKGRIHHSWLLGANGA